MMISCQEAMDLASRALDNQLSRRQRWMLKLHVWFCQGCRRYQHQIQRIHRLCRKADPELWLPRLNLTPQARERILKRLRRE